MKSHREGDTFTGWFFLVFLFVIFKSTWDKVYVVDSQIPFKNWLNQHDIAQGRLSMIILVDQDGPLADLDAGFLRIWRKRFPEKIYIPLIERGSFHVSKDYPEDLREEVDKIFFEPEFFLNLPLVPGAANALKNLLTLGHDVRICTSPLRRYQNCVLEKYQWVEKHLGFEFVSRIICSRDKSIIVGDLLVDDKPEIDGQERAGWEHIIFDKPYNGSASSQKRRLLSWKNLNSIL